MRGLDIIGGCGNKNKIHMSLTPEASKLLTFPSGGPEVAKAAGDVLDTKCKTFIGHSAEPAFDNGPCTCKISKQHSAEKASTAVSSPNEFSLEMGAMSLTDMLSHVSFQVYMAIHIFAALAALGGVTWKLAGICALSYTLRMFGITGGYHRLLSHRSYKTSRVGQFLLACLGCSAFQKGPLWWSSHHRHHHRTADTTADVHSPRMWGFWWSHFGWFLCTQEHEEVLWPAIPDLVRYPELLWLDRYHYIPPLGMAAAMFTVGGWPLVGWGFMVSTVLCWHATYCINSVAHLIGRRRYRCEFNTFCDARNNFWLALATLGEGWHNNHHCYMRSAKHGFYAHEIDMTWWMLLLLQSIGLVWDLELPPVHELEKRRFDSSHLKCRCEQVEKDLGQVENLMP